MERTSRIFALVTVAVPLLLVLGIILLEMPNLISIPTSLIHATSFLATWMVIRRNPGRPFLAFVVGFATALATIAVFLTTGLGADIGWIAALPGYLFTAAAGPALATLLTTAAVYQKAR